MPNISDRRMRILCIREHGRSNALRIISYVNNQLFSLIFVVLVALYVCDLPFMYIYVISLYTWHVDIEDNLLSISYVTQYSFIKYPMQSIYWSLSKAPQYFSTLQKNNYIRCKWAKRAITHFHENHAWMLIWYEKRTNRECFFFVLLYKNQAFLLKMIPVSLHSFLNEPWWHLPYNCFCFLVPCYFSSFSQLYKMNLYLTSVVWV